MGWGSWKTPRYMHHDFSDTDVGFFRRIKPTHKSLGKIRGRNGITRS